MRYRLLILSDRTVYLHYALRGQPFTGTQRRSHFTVGVTIYSFCCWPTTTTVGITDCDVATGRIQNDYRHLRGIEGYFFSLLLIANMPGRALYTIVPLLTFM